MREPSPADWADARALLGAGAQYLASGVSCTVFTDGRRALRLAGTGPGQVPPRFGVDAQIRSRLHAAGVPVAEVLEVGALPSGRAYSLDTLHPQLGGQPGPPGRADQGWADLGRALSALHALPHSGHGLLEDRPDTLRGLALTPVDGVLTRCRGAWPFNHQPLRAQPLVWAAPDLLPALAELEDDLWAAVQGRTAVCHTDLHAGQFQWQGGRLATLLDFGDAGAFVPEWDIASLACFHGWDVATQVAQAADLDAGPRAARLGLILALHRAVRADSDRAKLAQAVAFARSSLARL